MKRFLAILLILSLVLAGCSSKPSTDKDKDETKTVENAEEDEKGSKKVVLDCGFSNFDMDEISRLSGYKCEAQEHMPEDVLLKLLAGDSDVDIYFFSTDTVRQVKEKGFYYPIESEIIKDFNNSCFDHLRDVVTNDNGDTVGMIVNSSVEAIVYPAALEEETGVDMQSISTLEEFIGFLQGYKGERVGYLAHLQDSIYYELTYQYEKYFCNFPEKEFDYNTEMYKNIFTSTLPLRKEDGTSESFYGLIPTGYTGILETDIDIDKLLLIDVNYNEFARKPEEYMAQLRAIPLPKINDDCKNSRGASNAVINPYSKNIKGAIKVLETIAQNRDKVGFYYGEYPFIKKDISEYPDKYMKDTRLFKDFFNIASDGFVSEYNIGPYIYRGYVDKYRNGEYTADEAIAEYQRMVDIWLNE